MNCTFIVKYKYHGKSNLYRSTNFITHIHHIYHTIDVYLIEIILFDDHLEKTHRFELFMVLLSLQCETIKIGLYCFMLNYKFAIELWEFKTKCLGSWSNVKISSPKYK